MYLISVYFDDKSNKIISNYINKIAQKTGNTFMTDNHVPPHLTIMSVEVREEKKLTEVMEQLERSLTKGQIQLVSVGVLLPYVLYAAPVLNLYLEDMIEQVHDMVKHIPEVRMSRYYQPMQWLPHITLGKKLSKEQMQEAFSVMQELFIPMEVTVAFNALSIPPSSSTRPRSFAMAPVHTRPSATFSIASVDIFLPSAQRFTNSLYPRLT